MLNSCISFETRGSHRHFVAFVEEMTKLRCTYFMIVVKYNICSRGKQTISNFILKFFLTAGSTILGFFDQTENYVWKYHLLLIVILNL